MFKKDEQDKNRDWRAIEENQIRELWRTCKARVDELFHEFKYIKIPRVASQSPADGDTKTTPGLSRSLSIMYPRLLTEPNINGLKDKFNEHIEHVLEEAIRKHVSSYPIY